MMRYIFLIVFLWGVKQTVFAQESTYLFNHLTSKNGLSQSSGIAIHQDALGQIWIGTRDGLNKYDGTKITVYRSQEGNTSTITNNDILSIAEDHDGFLWIGTYNGLNRYDPKTDTFKQFFHSKEKNALCDNTIWAVKALSNGNICVGTNKGISVYNKKTDTFSSFLNGNDLEGTPSYLVLSILETREGDIFIGTTKGLLKGVKTKDEALNFKSIPLLENTYIQDVLQQNKTKILLATRAKGILVFDVTTNTTVPLIENGKANKSPENVRRLLFDDFNRLWVGTYNGLYIVEKNKTILLQSNISDTKSLSKNSIKALYKDKKGSIWVGTYYGGVNIWDITNANFRHIGEKQTGDGLNYSVVSSIESHKNKLFFGTEGGGVNILNKNTGKFTYVTKENSKIKGNNIKTLMKDQDGVLWIGTFKNGIELYNTETSRIQTQQHLPDTLLQRLKETGVYAIQKDKKHNLWIGTFGKGLFKYNTKNNTLEQFKYKANTINSLSSNFVRTICIDTNGIIWVGTEKGLNRITQDHHITQYFYDDTLKYGEDILSVYQDTQHHIWIGTKSRGLFRYNGEDFDKVAIFKTTNLSPSVHSIQEDVNKQLWLSTNQGIINYNYTTDTHKVYNQTAGLVSNEFNNNAGLKLDGTSFYFGGPSGVTYFNTSQLTTNNYTPQVILTEFNVKTNTDNKAEDVSQITPQTLPFTKAITLDYDQGNFSIKFSIPNYINSSNNTYKYKLKGLETEWNVTKTSVASYTIQKPGCYTFEVFGANGDGVWNANPTELTIEVKPAPWRSWWAFLSYACIILLALYFLIKILKTKTRLEHELVLEVIESERTKALNKTKLQFFTNISHEFRTPLALILGPLQQIIADYKGSSAMYKKLLVIENSANHLLHLINRLMDFRKFENNLFTLEAAEGNIVKFLKEIYLSFTEFAKQGNYNFNFICDYDELLVFYDRKKLERVFYNLISNAFRYTPQGGDITIRVYRNGHEIVIKIEDTGVGIAEEYKSKIFERFFEVAVNNKPDNNYSKGTGIGLSIAKNIVDLHKGHINVANNENAKGSVFTVKLPLGNAHLSESEILKDFKTSDDVSQYISQLEPTDHLQENDIGTVREDGKFTILLTEDNTQLRKFIRDLLLPVYNVLEAENGKVALKIAHKESIDLIVSDVIMPQMTGTELCAAIKSDIKTSHIPVILLTSRTSLIYKLEGLEQGADDYISKPFNVKEFLFKVQNILQARENIKKNFIANNDEGQESALPISSYDEKLYKKALQIVKENLANEAFNIPTFCSELGVSRTMLFTKIKAWSNLTPNEFINHFRMKRASQLLEKGKLNISQVSYQVGFKNPKYFSKCFQKKFGKTPSQYANKYTD